MFIQSANGFLVLTCGDHVVLFKSGVAIAENNGENNFDYVDGIDDCILIDLARGYPNMTLTKVTKLASFLGS